MATMHDPMSTYAQRYDAVSDALQQAERAHECGHLDTAAIGALRRATAFRTQVLHALDSISLSEESTDAEILAEIGAAVDDARENRIRIYAEAEGDRGGW